MSIYTIISLYVIVLVQCSFGCVCVRNNHTIAKNHLKGETGDIKQKRQLRFDEYSSLEFQLNSDPLDTDNGGNSNQTFIMTDATSTELNDIEKEVKFTSIEIKNITLAEQNNISMMTTSINNNFLYNDIFTTTDFATETNIMNEQNTIIDYSDTTDITDKENLDKVTERITDKDESDKVTEQTTYNEDLDKVTKQTTYEEDSDKVDEQTTAKEYSVKDQFKNCNTYKKVKQFDITRIADVWKITFYTFPTKLKCFKLHIKIVTSKDQVKYEKKYGSFDGKVRWKDCVLEITSSDHKRRGIPRRHFLQKNDSEFSVLTNIIIDYERHGNTTAVLHEENPDQWLPLKNLLLMRDCSTGDLVVFSRVPTEPMMSEIEDALVEFGEESRRVVNGTRACEDLVRAWVKVG